MVVNAKVKRVGDMKVTIYARELKRSIRHISWHILTAKWLYLKRKAHSSVIQKRGVIGFTPFDLYFLSHCHIHTVFQIFILDA